MDHIGLGGDHHAAALAPVTTADNDGRQLSREEIRRASSCSLQIHQDRRQLPSNAIEIAGDEQVFEIDEQLIKAQKQDSGVPLFQDIDNGVNPDQLLQAQAVNGNMLNNNAAIRQTSQIRPRDINARAAQK
ncbi:hypothetical protein QYF36_001870 [Acer negundo]|nr:hypothetical protein QYF36_001870 [Acer negundo]